MTRKIRTLLGILILAISIWLLIWGFAPARRETRIQNISPAEMQLPTPSSFHFDDDAGLLASLAKPSSPALAPGASVVFAQDALA